MNIRSISSLLLIAFFGIISCKKELEPQESSTTTDTSAVASTPNEAQAQPQQMQPQMQQPAQQMPGDVTQSNAVTVQPAPTPKGMNPAHGQPGHRCDIAVGAPLNSKPKPAAGATTITPGTSPTITSTQQVKAAPNSGQTPAILNPGTSAPATATAPGMNPPHGQDGHQCGIAVGAPLPK